LNLLRKICRTCEGGTGDVSSRTENSGGQFWKGLRSTKDCNARRRRRRRRKKRRSTSRRRRRRRSRRRRSYQRFGETRCLHLQDIWWRRQVPPTDN
jgi:hypothetical protein